MVGIFEGDEFRGSGMIILSEYVLTCEHVVEKITDSSDLDVQAVDGQELILDENNKFWIPRRLK